MFTQPLIHNLCNCITCKHTGLAILGLCLVLGGCSGSLTPAQQSVVTTGVDVGICILQQELLTPVPTPEQIAVTCLGANTPAFVTEVTNLLDAHKAAELAEQARK